ncbi:response regulator [Planctobacterium marinum]|uniref:response regulator n=1 Tax=Planctobacterium marinum TaxID=1631968 RepID=UPI001E55BD72|nr:response regulator [Planctobacterium marinum]MCC2607364.1 response regulator [Planctobacterium marinum]
MRANSIADLEVLLIDDDDVDAISVKRAFTKLNLQETLTRKSNAVEGLKYLRNRTRHRDIIVILDLEMPMMNGFEFLEELRNDTALCRTVVFMLSTSSSREDIQKAYARNIAGYICKENVGKDFEGLMQLIDGFGQVVNLPTLTKGGNHACAYN